jgi:hypothetical protein
MIVGNGGVELSQICQKSRKTIGRGASSIAVEGMSYEDAHCFYDWGEFCLHIIVTAFDAGSGSGAPSGSGGGQCGGSSDSGHSCYACDSGYASHCYTGGSCHAGAAG